MDAVSVIIGAIMAGLASGLSETTSFAIRDGYEKLKNALVGKSNSDEVMQKAFTNLEDNPSSDVWKNILHEELLKLKITENDELLTLARSLDALAHKTPSSTGKYNVSISDSNGIVVGDYSTVNQKISTTKGSKKPRNTKL